MPNTSHHDQTEAKHPLKHNTELERLELVLESQINHGHEINDEIDRTTSLKKSLVEVNVI